MRFYPNGPVATRHFGAVTWPCMLEGRKEGRKAGRKGNERKRKERGRIGTTLAGVIWLEGRKGEGRTEKSLVKTASGVRSPNFKNRVPCS